MYALNFSPEDKINQCQVGTGYIHSDKNNQFPLEKFLEDEFPMFSIKNFSMAEIGTIGKSKTISPVLFLYNKKTDEQVVCILRNEAHGISFWDFYKSPRDIKA